MTRRLAIALVLAVPAAAAAQPPAVQNGTVDVATAAGIEGAIAAAGREAQPSWVGWRAPMVPGDRDLCSTWSDGITMFRGEILESGPAGPATASAPASRTVALERGTSVVVLARVAGGRLERVRTTSDACTIDAGGRVLHWIPNISPAASVAFLDGLTRPASLAVHTSRRLAEAAVSAIGLHDTAEASATLERLLDPTSDAALRRAAAGMLASAHGDAGFARVRALAEREPDRRLRQQFVAALGSSPVPAAAETLAAIARSDADASVRGEAAVRYVRRAGAPGLDTAVRLLDAETDPGARRRIVSAIGSLAGDAGTATLVTLARGHADLQVRKAAVEALGRSSAPAARQLLEELVK